MIKDILKKVLKNGLLTIFIVAVFYILYLRECRRPDPCPPDNMVLVEQSFIDSLNVIANQPVKIDTIIPDPIIIYVKDDTPLPQPEPEPEDTTINNYADSLVTDYFTAWYNFQLQNNQLINRNWKYSVTGPIEIIIEKTVPQPVPYEVEAIRRSLYGSIAAGGDMDIFVYGIDLDYINKKNNLYGIQYRRFGNKGIIGFKMGIRIL